MFSVFCFRKDFLLRGFQAVLALRLQIFWWILSFLLNFLFAFLSLLALIFITASFGLFGFSLLNFLSEIHLIAFAVHSWVFSALCSQSLCFICQPSHLWGVQVLIGTLFQALIVLKILQFIMKFALHCSFHHLVKCVHFYCCTCTFSLLHVYISIATCVHFHCLLELDLSHFHLYPCWTSVWDFITICFYFPHINETAYLTISGKFTWSILFSFFVCVCVWSVKQYYLCTNPIFASPGSVRVTKTSCLWLCVF